MESNSGRVKTVICPSCDGENEKKVRFCVHCGNPFPRKKRFPFRNRYVLIGVIGLVFAGTILSFSMGRLESNLVGKVNGEGITRKELSKRVERAKKFYEVRYGQNLFQGEGGKENLNRLKTDILDEMTKEKILLQEAKSAATVQHLTKRLRSKWRRLKRSTVYQMMISSKRWA